MCNQSESEVSGKIEYRKISQAKNKRNKEKTRENKDCRVNKEFYMSSIVFGFLFLFARLSFFIPISSELSSITAEGLPLFLVSICASFGFMAAFFLRVAAGSLFSTSSTSVDIIPLTPLFHAPSDFTLLRKVSVCCYQPFGRTNRSGNETRFSTSCISLATWSNQESLGIGSVRWSSKRLVPNFLKSS